MVPWACQRWLLSAEPGKTPEHCQVWPKTTKRLLIDSNKLLWEPWGLWKDLWDGRWRSSPVRNADRKATECHREENIAMWRNREGRCGLEGKQGSKGLNGANVTFIVHMLCYSQIHSPCFPADVLFRCRPTSSSVSISHRISSIPLLISLSSVQPLLSHYDS